MSTTTHVPTAEEVSVDPRIAETIRELSTPPDELFEEVFGFEEGKYQKTARRAFPIIVRFAGAPALGSVLSIINIYWGLASTLYWTNRQVRKMAKYWGFLWGMDFFYWDTRKDTYWVKRRVNAQRAFFQINRTAKYRNQQGGAIEVNHKTFREAVKEGIRDAETCYNQMFDRLEKETAGRLIRILPEASTEERRKAYAEMARRIRKLAREAMHQEVFSRIPPEHVKAMLGG